MEFVDAFKPIITVWPSVIITLNSTWHCSHSSRNSRFLQLRESQYQTMPTFALWSVRGPLGSECFSLWMSLKLGIMAQAHSICWGLIVAWNRRLSNANNIEAGWDMTKNAVMMLTSFQAQLPFESDHYKLADLWWMNKVLTDTEPPTLKRQYYYNSYF